ncbi:MAG TPA: alpha/beta fold hydrolase [Pyrinomonadaceae bacterium]|nr:alpha/beta fold hydrolase [Pyrinomonadaceae bacterium]
MGHAGARLYAFGPFVLDAREGTLSRGGRPLALTPKAFETLLALVERGGHVVGKDELMRRVWPDSFVEENNLSQNISLLRKVLGQTEDSVYIETVPKRGYRFAPDVRELTEEPSPGETTRAVVTPQHDEDGALLSEDAAGRGRVFAAPPHEYSLHDSASPEFSASLSRAPETRYARSGDVNIAYQVVGDGPLDLVFVMGWVSHLEYFWKEPRFARFLLRLASFSRLILFDKRGTGLSDRVPLNELPTLEQRMDDVRAVLEAVGSERAALIGVSEGGPMSALFAATYPEKTLALVMIGTYARRMRDADYPWGPTPDEREHFLEEIREHWGGPLGLEERAPSAVGDVRFREWWAEYLRTGASPGAAVALTKMNAEIDVRQVLPTIRVPTLVLHRAGDLCLKAEEGRYVAEKIPGARFVELEGADHLPFVGDQDAILDEVEEFLTGVRHAHEPDRVLATVLFVNLVDSPARASEMGEARWRELLTTLRAQVRKEVERFRGREVDVEGAGALATFDGPARAVRAACAVRTAAARLGVEVRAGLHTGECDLLEGGRVGGLAVRIGEQVRARAAPGEVLVSSTVKDLVAGSGLRFEERGAHELEGVPGQWRLFRVARGVV